MLQKVLDNGSEMHTFVTGHKVHQILNHVNRLCDLNIWDVVHDYTQPDTNFLRQICVVQKFQNVEVFERTATTMDALKEFASKLYSNDILRIREIMSQKDLMSVRFEKVIYLLG